jgi:hypothetical protein
LPPYNEIYPFEEPELEDEDEEELEDKLLA